jgi:hypothetical protein
MSLRLPGLRLAEIEVEGKQQLVAFPWWVPRALGFDFSVRLVVRRVHHNELKAISLAEGTGPTVFGT